jgi:hypothetical protein
MATWAQKNLINICDIFLVTRMWNFPPKKSSLEGEPSFGFI